MPVRCNGNKNNLRIEISLVFLFNLEYLNAHFITCIGTDGLDIYLMITPCILISLRLGHLD
jgi:hypothetical protein